MGGRVFVLCEESSEGSKARLQDEVIPGDEAVGICRDGYPRAAAQDQARKEIRTGDNGSLHETDEDRATEDNYVVIGRESVLQNVGLQLWNAQSATNR